MFPHTSTVSIRMTKNCCDSAVSMTPWRPLSYFAQSPCTKSNPHAKMLQNLNHIGYSIIMKKFGEKSRKIVLVKT